MAKNTHLQQVIWQEFSSQYLPDELPPKWEESFIAQKLPEMARRSALRLKHALKNDNVQELIELLETSNRDPNHSFKQSVILRSLTEQMNPKTGLFFRSF